MNLEEIKKITLEKLSKIKNNNNHTIDRVIHSKEPLSPIIIKKIIKELNQKDVPLEKYPNQSYLNKVMNKCPLISGNKVTLLIDGPATYQEMLKAINKAKYHINFESFIFDNDKIGKLFSKLLIKKHNQGVKVNLIYDSAGCFFTAKSFFEKLRTAGINVIEFNPLNPLKTNGKGWHPNHRDHRKILIIDGKIAFTGGVNISSIYSSIVKKSIEKIKNIKNKNKTHAPKKIQKIVYTWRDTHVKIEGPAVEEFQKLFLKTWLDKNGPENDKKYFPTLKPKGKELIRVVGSTPGKMNRFTYMMYIAAFTYAKKHIYLTNAYFIPNKQILKSLINAKKRGVDVKIILPGNSDEKAVFYAGRSFYTKLLKSGVKIFNLRDDAMLHAKTAVIDNIWSTVGSTNMEQRSFLRNDEVNAAIISHKFADKMVHYFNQDLLNSKQILLENWKKRSFSNKLKEKFFRLFIYWL